MFKKWLLVTAITAVLAASLILTGCQNGTAALSSNQQNGISVTGEGRVSVTPDIATLQLGVTAQAATVADAQAQATDAMNKIMNALTANGVASKDIQTSYYNIQEVTQWNPVTQKSESTGYLVNNVVTATIRQVDKAGIVIDAAVAAGGDLTRVNNVSFSIDDPTASYDAARAKAVTQAVNKAKNMAEQAGVKLGSLIYLTESNYYVPPMVYYGKASAEAAASTPISAGEIDITVTVQAVYAIK